MAAVAGCMAMSHGPQLMMPPNRWQVLTAKDRREHGAALADRPARMIDYQPLYRSPPNVGCAMGFAVWEG